MVPFMRGKTPKITEVCGKTTPEALSGPRFRGWKSLRWRPGPRSPVTW